MNGREGLSISPRGAVPQAGEANMTAAYAVTSPGAPIELIEVADVPLGPLGVDVRVTHCGVCHTDIGMIDDEFGISRYPVVAGHEAVGVVERLGSAVPPDQLAVGQRVGVGATAGACFACEWCLSGRHHLCPAKDDVVFRGDRGAFASHVRATDWRFAHPIPPGMSSEHAGPLLCAGATVFTAIHQHEVRPTDHVAVVGLGGLGHVAVQFLAKWGCHVTAITSSADKAADARRFGAHQVIVAGPHGEGLAEVAKSFDFMISTVSADLPWDSYLATLRPQGKLALLGVPSRRISLSPLSLLPGERTLVGGVTGGPTITRTMLEFADRHGIQPEVELFAVSDIEAALNRTRTGQARYRVVLDYLT